MERDLIDVSKRYRLPDSSPPSPPELPKTPLYPALHTNTPVPTSKSLLFSHRILSSRLTFALSVTFPNFPFPPDTALFPPHDRVLQYHKDSVTHFSLASYIHLSHSIESAEYTTEDEEWTVELSVKGERRTRKYDHVISAVGRYHTPSIPVWQGQDEWIAGAEAGEREVLHSLWYRGAEKYSRRTVVVVGFGASGWDLAAQCVPVAKEVSAELAVALIGSIFDPNERFGADLPLIRRAPRRPLQTPTSRGDHTQTQDLPLHFLGDPLQRRHVNPSHLGHHPSRHRLLAACSLAEEPQRRST